MSSLFVYILVKLKFLFIIHIHFIAVRQRYPGFMRETPTDHEVTKKMKRAANVIDKFRSILLFIPMPMYKFYFLKIETSPI